MSDDETFEPPPIHDDVLARILDYVDDPDDPASAFFLGVICSSLWAIVGEENEDDPVTFSPRSVFLLGVDQLAKDIPHIVDQPPIVAMFAALWPTDDE